MGNAAPDKIQSLRDIRNVNFPLEPSNFRLLFVFNVYLTKIYSTYYFFVTPIHSISLQQLKVLLQVKSDRTFKLLYNWWFYKVVWRIEWSVSQTFYYLFGSAISTKIVEIAVRFMLGKTHQSVMKIKLLCALCVHVYILTDPKLKAKVETPYNSDS